jgi:hypothetical protein
LFESQYYINKVGDVDWVSLATDRNMWKGPFKLCKRQESAWLNGAAITGIFEKKKGEEFFDFECCNETNL